MVNSATLDARDRLTVDELARAAGTTVRNVRALQGNGLIPGPEVEGRTGFYGADHLLRLRAVLRLQNEGFSLAALRRLIRAWETGMTLEDVLGLPRLGSHTTDAGEDRDGDWDTDPFEEFGRRRRRGRRGRLFLVPTTIIGEATGTRDNERGISSAEAAS